MENEPPSWARDCQQRHGQESGRGLTPGDTIRFVVIGVLLIAIVGFVAAIRGS